MSYNRYLKTWECNIKMKTKTLGVRKDGVTYSVNLPPETRIVDLKRNAPVTIDTPPADADLKDLIGKLL